MSECLSPTILEGVRAGSLPPPEQASAEAHLAGCARCRDELEALRSGTRLPAEAQAPAEVASGGGAARLRPMLLPILVGVIGAGLFTFAVGGAATQRLLYNVHKTYADTYPSLDRPRLDISAEMPTNVFEVLSLVGLVGFFGMGLLTVLLVRPRDRWDDLAAGLLTSLSATLITIPVMAWATVLALAVVPSLSDYALFGEATQTTTDAGDDKKHPTDVLADKYPDLAKVAPNERGKKFFPKMVADQVVGTAYGVWSGIWLSLASSGVLALCGTFAAGYLVRRGDGILLILFPYLELTVPLTGLICALLTLPFGLIPEVEAGPYLWSLALLALLTLLCFIGVLYRWDWLLRVSLYLAYYFFLHGVSEQRFPPLLFVAAGAIPFIMMFRYFAPWNRPEPYPIYPFAALVGLPCLALGGAIGAWIQQDRAYRNEPVRILVAKDAYPQWSAIKDPSAMFEEKEMLRSEAPGDSMRARALAGLQGRILRRTIQAGAILTADDLLQPTGGGSLDTGLERRTRAFAVKLSGDPDYVLPGCRVDVVRCLARAGKEAECAYVAQNVLVKAADVAVDRPGDRPTLAGKIATLQVTSAQALLLANAQENGTVHLILRRIDDQAILPQLPMAPPLAGAKPPLDAGAAAPTVDEDLPGELRGQFDEKLTQGKPTFTLKVTADKAAGGFVLPGTHVDVIYTWPSGDTLKQSALLVEDALVLAINNERFRPEDRLALVPETVTLLVSAKQAALLSQAKKGGTFHLALRSIEDWGTTAAPDQPNP